MRSAWAVIIATALQLPGGASAQNHGDGWLACTFGEAPVARIEGRLVPTPYLLDRLQVTQRVYLEREGSEGQCMLMADGTFEFRDVPEGRYRLWVDSLLVAPSDPVSILIRGDTVVSLEVPIFPANAVSACLADLRCADRLAQPTSLEAAADEVRQAYLFGYRVSMAIGGGTWDDGVYCIDDTAQVLAALREVHPAVVPRAECELEPRAPQGRRPLTHVPSGRRAASIRPPEVQIVSETEAYLRVSRHTGARSGASYLCDIERLGDHWVVRTCHMIAIS